MREHLPQILTIDELADRLRLSKKTIYRWVYERKIPYLKLHGKLLFEEQRIFAFITASRGQDPFLSMPRQGNKPSQSSERDLSRKGSLK
jgi:excisionase family DNA binding protein